MRHLSRLWPRRTMRMRLTLLYAGLFLACAFVLLILSLGGWQHSSATAAVPAREVSLASPAPPSQQAFAAAVASPSTGPTCTRC